MNYNQKVGQFGEGLAIEFLVRHGYKIIDTNIKVSYKEIDIIAFKDDELIFIEVKTRTSNMFGRADEAIFAKKLKSLKRAVGIYLNNFNPKVKYKDIRLDLIAININRIEKIANIKHYENIA